GASQRVDLDFGGVGGEGAALPAAVVAVDAAADDGRASAVDHAGDRQLDGRVLGADDELAVDGQISRGNVDGSIRLLGVALQLDDRRIEQLPSGVERGVVHAPAARVCLTAAARTTRVGGQIGVDVRR